MPKLFFAIIPPLNVLETVHENTLPVLHTHPEWRVANDAQWHITIQYIGFVTPVAATKIWNAFETLTLPRAEKITIGGNPSTALLRHQLLHARVTEEKPFLSSTREVVRTIAPVVERENIIFHLTLARAKKKKGNPSSEIVSEIPPFTSTFLPLGVTLFRSEQQNEKVIHIPLSTRLFSL